jgi:hypothetical protein
MNDMITAPSALGELPCIGWELNQLHQNIDDIWARYALAPDQVRPELEAIKDEANRLNELVMDIERRHRRAA